jgi:hypothetical protein
VLSSKAMRVARGLSIALCGVAAACAALVTACGDDTSKPLGSGDKVIVDVDATNQPPQPEPKGGDLADSPYGPADAAYGAIDAAPGSPSHEN